LRYEGSKDEGYRQGLKGFLDARRGPRATRAEGGFENSWRKTAARASVTSVPMARRPGRAGTTCSRRAENIRRDFYDLGTDVPDASRLADTFAELALVI